MLVVGPRLVLRPPVPDEIVRGSFWSAYVGDWIVENRCGEGLMCEALGLALRHAFETLGLHRIEANILAAPGNGGTAGLPGAGGAPADPSTDAERAGAETRATQEASVTRARTVV